MQPIIIASEKFVEHQTPPGHPECPERAEVMDVVAAEWRQRGGEVVAPREVTDAQLARVHDSAYLARLAGLAGVATALDPDTYTSPESVAVARIAAGAAIEAVERVMGAGRGSALALMRPPGHHAERGKAMGFCLYNNVAVAAAHAKTIGASRIAIVDYDVHHGNGTQHIFEADRSVLYVSTHQYPYYPGTGDATEIGRDDGLGFTVNVPLAAWSTDADYGLVFDQIVLPVVTQFHPDLVLVSAGFDAHERDPLGGMRLTTPAFAAMTLALRGVADTCCDGRLVAVVEGGYDLGAFRASLAGARDALAQPNRSAPQWPTSPASSSRGATAVKAVKAAIARHWSL
jgi:acetoin utilization deacetylase AcuC-like enzyme